MKKWMTFLTVLLAVMVVTAAAQSTGGKPVGITDQILGAILGGALFGIPFIGLIQLVKTGLVKLFKMTEPTKPWVGYLASAVVCAVLAAITLTGLGMLNIQNMLTATLMAWLVANGYYKRQNAIAELTATKMNGGA
jgi:hypothetical protein